MAYILDDMAGIFNSSGEAFRNGVDSGVERTSKDIMAIVSSISSKCETDGDIQGFKLAEMICGEIRKRYFKALGLNRSSSHS